MQRVADLLVIDGLTTYEDSPRHRRARPLQPTRRGRRVPRVISEAQQSWADALGAEIGEAKLRRAGGLLGEIQCAVATKGMRAPRG